MFSLILTVLMTITLFWIRFKKVKKLGLELSFLYQRELDALLNNSKQYNNTASANDTYNAAEASLINFIMGGGKLFINPIDFEDTTFTWFPLDPSAIPRTRRGRERCYVADYVRTLRNRCF